MSHKCLLGWEPKTKKAIAYDSYIFETLAYDITLRSRWSCHPRITHSVKGFCVTCHSQEGVRCKSLQLKGSGLSNS